MYDDVNQLIRENNTYLNKTVTYAYDVGGNLVTKKEYAYTTGTLGAVTSTVTNTYGDSKWKDKLTKYNGTAISYDAIGNTTNWRDGAALTWKNGRQMATYSKTGTSVSYKYNDAGIRTQKTVNGAVTEYYYNGGNLAYEVRKNSSGAVTHTIGYTDFGLTVNGVAYFYVFNGQNDVIGLVSNSSARVVNYTYDSWGKLLSITGSLASTIGEINPIRYRGYYYDTESGMYYIGTRYHDPVVGRFINPDMALGVNGDISTYNLYIYCGNNPVNRYDVNGMVWEDLWEKTKAIAKAVLHQGNTIAVDMGIDTAAIAARFLNMTEEEGNNGIYHANFDCWQQYFGFNNFYDFIFDASTSMLPAKFPFSHNGSGYIIWAWKGDYITLGAGAELGIYCGNGPHYFVDKSLGAGISLILRYKGDTIIDYIAGSPQWWLTAFNSNVLNVNAADLTAIFIFGFSDSAMGKSFYNQWIGKDPRLSYSAKQDIFYFYFW